MPFFGRHENSKRKNHYIKTKRDCNLKKRAGRKNVRLNFMTRLAKKFYVGKPILHCLTQNIGLIAPFPHKNFKAHFQKRNGAKVIAL